MLEVGYEVSDFGNGWRRHVNVNLEVMTLFNWKLHDTIAGAAVV